MNCRVFVWKQKVLLDTISETGSAFKQKTNKNHVPSGHSGKHAPGKKKKQKNQLFQKILFSLLYHLQILLKMQSCRAGVAPWLAENTERSPRPRMLWPDGRGRWWHPNPVTTSQGPCWRLRGTLGCPERRGGLALDSASKRGLPMGTAGFFPPLPPRWLLWVSKNPQHR